MTELFETLYNLFDLKDPEIQDCFTAAIHESLYDVHRQLESIDQHLADIAECLKAKHDNSDIQEAYESIQEYVSDYTDRAGRDSAETSKAYDRGVIHGLMLALTQLRGAGTE